MYLTLCENNLTFGVITAFSNENYTFKKLSSVHNFLLN